jgi:hypothetical protein
MSLYDFNQYYYDLLKKVQDIARNSPEKLLVVSRPIKQAIKTNYHSFDKESDVYRNFFLQATEPTRASWDKIQDTLSIDDAKEWLMSEDVANAELFKDISFGAIGALMKSKKTIFYYFTLLCIFGDESMDETEVNNIISLLKSIQDTEQFNADVENFTNEQTKKHLKYLQYLQSQSSSGASTGGSAIENTMKELESTSLGKLAKEIMEDVDVSEIHKSF